MKLGKSGAGFTLVELMIVVAIVAVLSSVAIPKLLSARVSTNENAAISTLRAIAAAQAQLQSACAIDTDADGSGEFGFLGEMAGTAPLRIWDPATLNPGQDVGLLDPPLLATPFGDLVKDSTTTDCVVQRAGYFFKVYLPGTTNGGLVPGVAETGPIAIGGQDPAQTFPDSDNCEIYWCAYAWPVSPESTGNRVFFINQEGDVLQTLNNEGNTNVAQFYDGLNSCPAFDAALSNMVGDPNPNSLTGMAADLGITIQLAAQGAETNDGNVWTVIQGSD